MASNGPISRKSVKSGVSSNPRAGKRQKTHVVINVDDDVDEDADENADDEAGEYSASEGNEARQRELIKAHNASGVEIARENRKITRMHATRVAVLEGQAKLERQRAECVPDSFTKLITKSSRLITRTGSAVASHRKKATLRPQQHIRSNKQSSF